MDSGEKYHRESISMDINPNKFYINNTQVYDNHEIISTEVKQT